jgi:ABC-type transporter Mla subunit MlaD
MTRRRVSVPVRFIILLAAVCAVVIVLLVTGSADDKAEPGSSGRVPVPTATPDSTQAVP